MRKKNFNAHKMKEARCLPIMPFPTVLEVWEGAKAGIDLQLPKRWWSWPP